MSRHDTHHIDQLNILDLIQQDVHLKRAAKTNGGEYAGPCPFCGDGKDRFRVWPNHPTGRGQYWCRQCERSGDAIQYLRDRDGLSFPEALQALSSGVTPFTRNPRPRNEATSQREPTSTPPPKPETPHTTTQEAGRYTYRNAEGQPLFQVRRLHLLNDEGERVSKRFVQYRYDEGRWLPGLEETERVIYRLPEIKKAITRGEVIYIVEGEKCVHTLHALGLEATTTPMGANAWKPEYIAQLAGAKIIIIPDNDEPGFNHARAIAEDLFPHCEWVKFCDLPHLAPGEDVHDWLEAGRTLEDFNAYIATLDNWMPMPNFELGQYLGDGIPDLDSVVPPMPEEPTGEWLDEYVAYAAKIAPLSPRTFHESAALWLVSVAVARRMAVKMKFDTIYPNLFISWIAPTTMWTKTTSLKVARNIARETIPHLLTPEETTHEALLSDMAGYRPVNFNGNDPDMLHEIELWKEERNFAAQRGWILDEMSGLLASAGKDYNAGLLEALMRFYDCEPLYRRSTRGQGRITIRNAYMSFIGSSTPASMAKHLSSPELWANGWWPRFLLITPEEDYPNWETPLQTTRNPEYIMDRIRTINEALPQPEWPNPPETTFIPMSESARRAWERYAQAMRHTKLVEAVQGLNDLEERVFGAYGRLPVAAVKVAILLAIMDWDPEMGLPRIEMRHMARAINMTEEWRKSMHRLLKNINQSRYDKLRMRILRQIGRFGKKGASERDLIKNMRDLTPNTIRGVLDQMLMAGDIFTYKYQHPGGGRPSHKFLPTTLLEETRTKESTVEITLPPPLNQEEDAVDVIPVNNKPKQKEPAKTIAQEDATSEATLSVPPPQVDDKTQSQDTKSAATNPEPVADTPAEQEVSERPRAGQAAGGTPSPIPKPEVTASPSPEPPKPISEMSTAERLRWRRQSRNRNAEGVTEGDAPPDEGTG